MAPFTTWQFQMGVLVARCSLGSSSWSKIESTFTPSYLTGINRFITSLFYVYNQACDEPICTQKNARDHSVFLVLDHSVFLVFLGCFAGPFFPAISGPIQIKNPC